MKESHGEGVAIHSGPEPCEGGREAALEALDRGICRLGIELRNQSCSGSRRCHAIGKATTRHAVARAGRGPVESKTLGMQRNYMRENREAPLPPADSGRAGGRTR
jgi:hypothetical protein